MVIRSSGLSGYAWFVVVIPALPVGVVRGIWAFAGVSWQGYALAVARCGWLYIGRSQSGGRAGGRGDGSRERVQEPGSVIARSC